MTQRSIVLDIETTGLYVNEGHRMTEIGLIELIDNKPTGKTLHFYLNPERDIPEFITKLTGLTEGFLSDKPLFAEVAQEVRDFIADSPIIITCRHDEKTGYTLDIAFLSHEFEAAGITDAIPETQWINIRKWSEEMFGHDEAKLDKILDRYQIDRTERDENGHGALLDADLLAKAYPKVLKDYTKFKAGQRPKPKTGKAPKV